MKFLILSLSAGGGHNSAADAMMQALRGMGAEAEVYDCYAILSPAKSKLICGAYLNIVKYTPKLFGGIYRLSGALSSPKHKSVVYAANTGQAGKLTRFIREKDPDGIIATHIFAAQQITYLKRHGKINCWTAGILTDYDYQPFWDDTELDMYYLPHEHFFADFVRHGIPLHRLRAMGIPVSPDIAAHRSVVDAKRHFGYDPARKHVLIAGGSMGAGRIPDIVRALNAGIDRDVQFSVVCGSNRTMMNRLKKMGFPERRVRVMGYVKPLHELMCAADVILSKPGGLSSTEAMAQRIPMVIVHPIEGVETNNALFFEKTGLALYPRTDEDIVRATQALLAEESASRAMRARQATWIPVSASQRIAAHALECARLPRP